MERNKSNAPHYTWGEVCSGWHLVINADLSVIQEIIPPKSGEVTHQHHRTQQFFYILKGIASFEVDDQSIEIPEGSGVHIEPGVNHRIWNGKNKNLEFLIISQPIVGADRHKE